MKRRTFIRNTSLSVPLLVNGVNMQAMPKSSFFNTVNGESDRVLVLIQLDGGNDGLAMITPYDQYDKLANVRGNIIVPEASLIDVGFDNGLHPVMTGLKSQIDEGKISVVQSVGYPNQNRSHFRSTDIWTSGSPADQHWTTGWLGRYFQGVAPDFPEGYPNSDCPDPFALAMGPNVSETCQGTIANYSMAIADPFNVNPLLNIEGSTPPNTPYGDELAFLRTAIEQTNAYGETILEAAENATNMVDYPGADVNPLAAQLKNVALLIAGGLQTKVYVVRLGGFDTHAAQVGDSPAVGAHANLLGMLSEAMDLFQQDLTLLGQDQRVLTMTFSEFGRRIRSNDSLGTDHGDAAPLIVMGSCVAPGFLGDNPEIPEDPGIQDAVPMQYDFRNVYGSVLMDWFEVEEEEVKNLLFEDFTYLPIIEGCEPVSAATEVEAELETVVYPNPFARQVNISFSCANEHVHLSLFNGRGQQLAVLVNRKLGAGQHQMSYDGRDLPAGTYYFHLQLENGRQKTKLVVKS